MLPLNKLKLNLLKYDFYSTKYTIIWKLRHRLFYIRLNRIIPIKNLSKIEHKHIAKLTIRRELFLFVIIMKK